MTRSYSYERIVTTLQGEEVIKKEAILWYKWNIHGSPFEQCEHFIAVTKDINATNHVGITVLQSAIKFHAGHDIVSLLLKNGADMRARDKNGMTAILYAKQYKASKKVLEHLRDYAKLVGITPLHVAIMLRLEPKSVREILEKGVEIEAEDNEKATPLHYAFKFKATLEVVTILLEYDADMCAVDKHMMTPLQYADEESEVILYHFQPLLIISDG